MRTKVVILLLITQLIFLCTSKASCDEDRTLKAAYDIQIKKIGIRNKLTFEGYDLARKGLYEEAIAKFRLAADSSLTTHEYERAVPIGSIVEAYQREGKFEDALKEHQWFMRSKKPSDAALEKQAEILALIKARGINNNGPIYSYINRISIKYSKYLPPEGYLAGTSGIIISDFIHLYDYMHDYDSGIVFIGKVIKYHVENKSSAHRLAHARDVVEYQRVKEAWELDKKTGKHGHLQEVIKTSDVISW